MAPRQPIINRRSGTSARSSAKELSQLIAREINRSIPAEEILDLIYLKFHLISQLGHEIHDGIEADRELEALLQARNQRID